MVNLEFYLCLSPGFEPQVGEKFDFICKKKKKKNSCLERLVTWVGTIRFDASRRGLLIKMKARTVAGRG